MVKSSTISEDVKHVLLVIAEMVKDSSETFTQDKLSETDLKELTEFARSDTDLTVLNIPGFFAELFLQSQKEKFIWKNITRLSSEERKILFFTANRHDPALISESLNYLSPDKYWTKLEETKIRYLNLSGEIFEKSDFRELYNSMQKVLAHYLELSDLIDTQKDISKHRKGLRIILPSGLVFLLLTYVFLWNIIFPPNGELIFLAKLNQIESVLKPYTDSASPQFELNELILSERYPEALEFIEEEKSLSNELSDELYFIEALLIFEEGNIREGKNRIRGLIFVNEELYNQLYKGILWRTRFCRQ